MSARSLMQQRPHACTPDLTVTPEKGGARDQPATLALIYLELTICTQYPCVYDEEQPTNEGVRLDWTTTTEH